MSYLKEKVAYLKGMAEGMQLSDQSNENKLLHAIIDVLEDVALAVEDVEEIQDQMNDQIDSIDEDLAEMERIILDYDDDEDAEIDCPHCGGTIDIEDAIENEADFIECPHCRKKIEIDWDCDCEDHECECSHDHNHDA